MFTSQVYNSNFGVQTQRKVIQSLKHDLKIQYDNQRRRQRRASHLAHWCEAHLPELHREDGTHSTDQPGGSGWPIHEAQTSSKSSGTHPAKIYYNNKPEYSNTQQGLPDYWYILSRLLICRAFWLCSSFAEKPLLLGPYFHSFSTSCVDSYN